MRDTRRSRWFWIFALLIAAAGWFSQTTRAEQPAPPSPEQTLIQQLDSPLLFVKRFNYLGIHIYDTYYKWRPGGGIYILENPADPPEQHRIRPVIDPTTPETLGPGIYSDPDLSYDGRRVLFCFKGSEQGSTGIYEIGIDGKGLRQISDPTCSLECYKGSHGGQHDVAPAYMPDGRIVLLSTRKSGLVPCANEGVAILHVMNADGSGLHTISVNNVNEFDPCVMDDGRILFGRWEYVDKTALTVQSLWTVMPDGTQETALFANNMVFPEAILDARSVPGNPYLVVGSFTPHNSPPRGAIGMIDIRKGKDSPEAIFNFDSPENPTHDRGESCEPWPLSSDVVLYSGQPAKGAPNALMMVDRQGHRVVVHADATIDLHSPIPIKARPRPPVVQGVADYDWHTGRFFVNDIYQGLDGVEPGTVKQLRVVEETSRVSATPGGDLNQTFLVSAALAFSAKNYLGVVPVEPDGSAYFEVPSGRAIYLQALDADGRLVRSMRTFIQATPGTTRSCVGCHEYKYGTSYSQTDAMPAALQREPSRLRSESWGTGFVDYPSMVQPILDKHCVKCHGGEGGFAGKIDLTGGWTRLFSVGYENLVSRRENQLTASLISGIDCMNGTARWSSIIFGPYAHGSGNAPLADVLVSGHKGRIPDLSRAERDLILAWIDSNGLYHGTWDYTDYGCSIPSWEGTKNELIAAMNEAGCARCHGDGNRVTQFEDDWFNLQHPEWSRILRAPLAKTATDGLGLSLCSEQPVDMRHRRIRILATGQYVHSVLPMDAFTPQPPPAEYDATKPAAVSFASTDDPHYQKMLQIIRRGRALALSTPRVDMPGAEIRPGDWRKLIPVPLPEQLPKLAAAIDIEGVVTLAWDRTSDTIGLQAEVHRGPSPDFAPSAETLLTTTPLFQFADTRAAVGENHYALVLLSETDRSEPIRLSVAVPEPTPPAAPAQVAAQGDFGRVWVRWAPVERMACKYHVYRRSPAGGEPVRLTAEPAGAIEFCDSGLEENQPFVYAVSTVSRRGLEGPLSPWSEPAAALPEIREPTLQLPLADSLQGRWLDGSAIEAQAAGGAHVADGSLDLSQGGFLTVPHHEAFDLQDRLSVEFWVKLDSPGQIPVLVSCGHWNTAGWFLQNLGGTWRWHVGRVDCDGGSPRIGQWTHLVGTLDGNRLCLYENGKLLGEKTAAPFTGLWNGPLVVGQYSQQDASFQTTGRITGLKIYRRALSPADVEKAFQAGQPGE